MNKELFLEELKKINIEISEEQYNQFETYCEFLIEKNKQYNLTAIKEHDDVFLKHFYDSITILNSMELNENTKVIDIGTGAGFPGMVIKIMHPEIELTVLDSNNKKITFLQELASKLNLNKINYVHNRSEEYYKEVGNIYDYVVARAVSNLPVLTEICLPFAKVGGYFISMKGDATEELKEAEYGIKVIGGEVKEVKTFKLPIELSQRTIIKIEKIKNTPKEYPRRYDKITKYPLKKK